MEHRWITSTGELASSKLHSSHRSFILIQKLQIFQRIDIKCLQETSKRLTVGFLLVSLLPPLTMPRVHFHLPYQAL